MLDDSPRGKEGYSGRPSSAARWEMSDEGSLALISRRVGPIKIVGQTLLFGWALPYYYKVRQASTV